MRKRIFDYGEIENGNVSNDISAETFTKNNKFKMSSSEMMCFVHFLPLMIGEKIFEDDKVWLFLLLLVEIVLMSFKISPKY